MYVDIIVAFIPINETGSDSVTKTFSCATASPTIAWMVSSLSLFSSIE